jgi:hypothetical protein
MLLYKKSRAPDTISQNNNDKIHFSDIEQFEGYVVVSTEK